MVGVLAVVCVLFRFINPSHCVFFFKQALWAHFDLTGSGAQTQEGASGAYVTGLHTSSITSQHVYYETGAALEHHLHNFTPPTATERCLCVLRDPELLCIYPPDGQARARRGCFTSVPFNYWKKRGKIDPDIFT